MTSTALGGGPLSESKFRALCAELLDELEYQTSYETNAENCAALQDRARAALDTPPQEPPTVEEIDRCIEHWKELCNYPTTRDRFKWAYLLDRDDILNAVRAILERWG
jgi:hypothetical protein